MTSTIAARTIAIEDAQLNKYGAGSTLGPGAFQPLSRVSPSLRGTDKSDRAENDLPRYESLRIDAKHFVM
jgi:hypothetical protein